MERLTAEILGRYNAAGLAALLESCPQIDGVQFRMNYESGVSEDRQAGYYEPQFRAVAGCGRPIRLDLRAKGLTDDTIRLAREIVPDTVVSTKHWCRASRHALPDAGNPAVRPEALPPLRHLGPAAQAASLCADPPPLERGEPAPAAVGRIRSGCGGSPTPCTYGGDGFEVMAPLTNKGVRDDQPPWPVSADPAFRSPAAEHGRHWMFYLLFGRLGYAPDASPEVWRRELRQRFGARGRFRGGALPHRRPDPAPAHRRCCSTRPASGPSGPSASRAAAWRRTRRSSPATRPGSTASTSTWGDALADRLCGKWTPPHVADNLRRLADRVRGLLGDLDGESAEAELRHTLLDFTLLTHLAEYHACRLLAAVQLAFFRHAGGGLPAAPRSGNSWKRPAATGGPCLQRPRGPTARISSSGSGRKATPATGGMT